MNTYKAIFTLVIALFSLQFATANGTPTAADDDKALVVKTETNTKNTVDLRLIAYATPKLTIHLKDATGKVIYFEKVKDQRHYFRRFSLAEVPDGQYHFSIRQAAADETVKHFTLENGVVTFASQQTILVGNTYKTATSIGLQYVDNQSINLVCHNPTNEKVTLRLVDTTGKVWFFTKVKAHENYAKRLQLEALPAGDYQWEMNHQPVEAKHDLRVDKNGLRLKQDLPRA